ncbi:hypothetical protein ElyMa_006652800 [Elysia marginata]|uniref:Uncharacterized protein n=1 Tax=Elysia marginata TaxID=1093978 RepID=A0AAV4IJM0_9GAST|nr:hypothetical protein ElyMa_006652800 [Elysia marginata]
MLMRNMNEKAGCLKLILPDAVYKLRTPDGLLRSQGCCRMASLFSGWNCFSCKPLRSFTFTACPSSRVKYQDLRLSPSWWENFRWDTNRAAVLRFKDDLKILR